MTREQLIELGNRIMHADGSEGELEVLMDLFDRNVPHPHGSNLFFYPPDHKARQALESYNPSVEQVVDLCLAYRPILL